MRWITACVEMKAGSAAAQLGACVPGMSGCSWEQALHPGKGSSGLQEVLRYHREVRSDGCVQRTRGAAIPRSSS